MASNKETVRLVRLISGEEIIADLAGQMHASLKAVKLSQLSLHLKEPRIVISQPGPKGLQIALLPWLPYKKAGLEGVEVSVDSVIFMVELDEQMLNEYIKATSSLVLPDSKLTL